MSVKTFAPVLGKTIRVTALDKCGAPLDTESDGGFVATDGFISVTLSAEVEDGDEIITKKANGQLCVNEKLSAAFKRFTVEVELCGVHPILADWMTNAVKYSDGGSENIIGVTVPEGNIEQKFALELWTGISGVACEDGEESSGYFLLPFVNGGRFDDITVDGENAVSFKITDAYTKGGNDWGVGPYDVYNDGTADGPLPNALDTGDHLLMIQANVAPPANSDGVQDLPSQA